MKKITFLFITLLCFHLGFSQQTISFEASEGYTLGDINTQNSWVTTGTGPGTFITNQVISDELATDGSNSLKIVQETAFPGQSSAIVGAFYNYAAAIPQEGSTFSADINISQQDTNSSNYIFGLVNLTAGSFITWLEFDFGGNIFVLVDDGLGTVVRNDTGVAWSANTWYNIRLEFTGGIITFFVDDTEIATGSVIVPGAIEQVRFSHDNFEGFAYIDNFRTNDEDLSVDSFEDDSFKHYYDKTVKTLTLESTNTPFSSIEIYNILGQQAFNKSLSQTLETIDMSSLKDGVYLAKVNIEGRTETFKILKQ